MIIHECPRCGALMEHQDDEPDVNIVVGWYCTACGFEEGEDYGE